MNEEKLFRLLMEAGLVVTGPIPSINALRKDFGMRFEVAKKWVVVFNKLPKRFAYDSQKATAAAKRLREICVDFLNLDNSANDIDVRQAVVQQSIANEQDLRDDKFINNTKLSRMPEGPSDDIDYEYHLTTEDLKNFVPTDGLS